MYHARNVFVAQHKRSVFVFGFYNSSIRILNELQLNYVSLLGAKKKRIIKVQLRANKTVNSKSVVLLLMYFLILEIFRMRIEGTLNYCINMCESDIVSSKITPRL